MHLFFPFSLRTNPIRNERNYLHLNSGKYVSPEEKNQTVGGGKFRRREDNK
ncbi:hypothetical protein LEP1GSC188_1799 [Leptospira weilii serovar Topaz str. LT2116]|uniref:Uncharacterized protein n=1 Tax=Leptospira weilii serovar Topaz str. LT2116 TaxID=1088540 RepID=M3EFK9_9LEPT|nr:hypothetical protein LEP1GSC188_1799 [Leptospira weilii serovar Topaz str. LT2116]